MGVVGGDVVVFAGVDDDPGGRADPAREELVDEGAAHIDVAEDDTVDRVVQDHVQPLPRLAAISGMQRPEHSWSAGCSVLFSLRRRGRAHHLKLACVA